MPKKTENLNLPSEAEIVRFEMLQKLLYASFVEMKEFSKKKPDEFLNRFKVKSLNRILDPIKELLREEPTIPFLDLLDEETIPSYSDSILIIAQFQSAMTQYFATYNGRTTKYEDSRRWFTKENPGTHYKKSDEEAEINFM